ncbi:MAG: class I SAM-dependent methyltransferase [Phycisphaeraceae bacterium]|nr:class I SAM-dependent methyltransferase [Phycisphaeraceae bacterium]
MSILYHQLAHLWPLLSPPADYHAEARRITTILRRHLARPPRGQRPTLLDLGTGGGHLLSHLKHQFTATAVDLSPAMLDNARRLNPDVEHHEGDMRSIRLDRTFDVVLLHDAIDYMTTPDDVHLALTTARHHLRPGGVTLFSPAYVAETFLDHEAEHDHHHVPGPPEIDLTYFTYVHDPDPADTRVEMVLLLLIRQDGQLTIHQDRQQLGLFPTDHWLAMLRLADLTPSSEPASRSRTASHGAPWFVGRG